MRERLTAEGVDQVLRELARRLDEAGVEAQIAIVGAAAILWHYDCTRVSTLDVDSWIACSDHARVRIDVVLAEIARERGWPDDWLDDRVATNGFIPEDATRENDFSLVIETGLVRIHVATPELLFAMKFRAGRGDRDLPDLEILAPLVPVRTSEQAVAIYESRYPEHPLKPASKRWIERYFA